MTMLVCVLTSLVLVVLAGPQLASCGPDRTIIASCGPGRTIIANCDPARTTSTKEVKTQTSMVMHTSFALF
jgi:hypothetical protein